MATTTDTTEAQPAGPAQATPAAKKRTWPTTREWLPWAILIAVALFLRLYDLGARAFHHDESQVAYFSYLFQKNHTYVYQPILHGPWMYSATAAVYQFFGVSDFTARLAPALMGTVMVGLPFFVRRQLGQIAAFTAGALLCVAPTILYFSRFAREDIHVATFSLAWIVVAIRMLDRPRAWHPPALFALMALAYTVKESTLFFGALVIAFMLGALLVEFVRRSRDATETSSRKVFDALRGVPWWSWLIAFAAFWIIFTAFYTSWFTHWHGFVDGIYYGPKYWKEQQGVGRGGEPGFFYIGVMVGEEWPILLLGLVGAFFAVRRPSTQWTLFVWLAIAQIVIYWKASEKFAWLTMHQLIPLIFLSGLAIQTLWEHRHAWVPRIALAVGSLTLLYTIGSSWYINAAQPINPHDLLVSTQSAADTEHIRDQLVALDKKVQKEQKRKLTVTVDPYEGASFPYAWYLRNLSAGYDTCVRLDPKTGKPVCGTPYTPTADVLILTEETKNELQDKLGAYQGRKFHFRVWWIHNFHNSGFKHPKAWWNYWFHRDSWDPKGGMDEYIYVKRNL